MRRSITTALIVLLLSTILSGCVYGNRIREMNAPAAGEYIVVVQNAVDQYKKRTGFPPIKNKEMDTPIYEKYQVDFNKLLNYKMIQTLPTNAFENGGNAIYVLIDVETQPKVKLMDLTSYQRLVELQKEVNQYSQRHDGQFPLGTMITPHVYTLDTGKLSLQDTQIRSPYSRQFLNLVITDTGIVAIDYAPEIMKAMNKKGMKEADPKVDLRSILVEEAFYVPARSFPYHWMNGQPTISEN